MAEQPQETPSDRYDDAFNRLKVADQELTDLLGTLTVVSEAIRVGPADLVINNGQPTTARQATGVRSKEIQARSWPDAIRLQSLFDEWRAAREELLTSWNLVPVHRRASRIDPEGAPGGKNWGR